MLSFVVKYLKIQRVIVMLLPDSIHPKHSVYYTGAIVLQTLHRSGTMKFVDLFVEMKKSNDMSLRLFTITLDWLYLINAAIINEKGEISLCS
jgi:hypothetical protein